MRSHRFRALATSVVVALGIVFGLGSGGASQAMRAIASHAGVITTTITADTTTQWPTRVVTFTVTATGDLGIVGQFLPDLQVYDVTTGQIVHTCATSTTCTFQVTQPTPQTHAYEGRTVPFDGSNVVSQSSPISVNWKGVTVSLVASTNNPIAGQPAVTLTATTSEQIGPSPFYTQIYDVTTDTRLTTSQQCGGGTTCQVQQQYNVATSNTYIAYESANDTGLPPSEAQEASNQVVVSWCAPNPGC